MQRFLEGLSLIFVLGASNCSAVSGSAPEPGDTSLRSDVMPILERNGCASANCHADRTKPMTHFSDFRTAEQVYASWVNWPSFQHCIEGRSDIAIDAPPLGKPRVTPGDPSNSFLLEKLRDTRDHCGPFYGRMPPPPWAPMPAAEIAVIERWIVEGAKNN